jgi:hypothetical protein
MHATSESAIPVAPARSLPEVSIDASKTKDRTSTQPVAWISVSESPRTRSASRTTTAPKAETIGLTIEIGPSSSAL